ncbi:unnamed protein product, partial [Rotaria sp. Silwood2]
DEFKAHSDVYTSTTGTAHNVSASHDFNAPHGHTIPTKIEVKTSDSQKPSII